MDDSLMNAWKQGRTTLKRGKNAGEYIPTWQVGQEQPELGYRTYADDGYGKNSLIYSCIKEKATSFGSLKPLVVRSDGTSVKGHRMVTLLENPNPFQDGQDFAELAKTQYEAGGNVYIQKHLTTSDPDRRREFAGYPVMELELIRPDYVQIAPGRRRQDDQFVVIVEGREVRRIPRAEMIHIHEPHLTNDFYGLSKIALLTREGAIDLSMSDFELAFFRNAGVPMGLLQVKGTYTKAETDEVKLSFRKAYNGLRKWFDLLVLNSDEATYQAMGMKQSDMEMDSTRFHAESRICSVFGVPGIIVGARYAMQAGAQMPYAEAEHAFWAETMVPDAMRFARAYQKFLLPDFATTRDRNASVLYDFTTVRALQEDRSRKLREVVRMVLTGGWTVNQSLVLVGMEAIVGGDFYIRNGNQVVVALDGTITPMVESTGNTPNPDNPLEGAAGLQLEQVLRRVPMLA